MDKQQTERWQETARRIDPRCALLRTWPLAGGVSAQTVALEVARADGGRRKFVVRVHGERDLRANPNIAADEYRLLEIVRAHGIAAPAPVYVDLSREVLPVPYLVVEYVEGEAECSAATPGECVARLAAQLAAIHSIDGEKPDLSFLPSQEERVRARLAARPRPADEAFPAGPILAALDGGRAFASRNRRTLLHGDYWPGNVLWQDGRIAAVIDWEDAALGDPLADLANGRLEIAWKWDFAAMESFTRAYATHASLDFADLPLWDLYAALRHGSALADWGLDAAAERAMRERLLRFAAQALAALR